MILLSHCVVTLLQTSCWTSPCSLLRVMSALCGYNRYIYIQNIYIVMKLPSVCVVEDGRPSLIKSLFPPTVGTGQRNIAAAVRDRFLGS